MTAAPFDTLKLSRGLRERAHLDQEQADGFAEVLGEAFQEQIAIKPDILLLRNELKGEILALRTELKAEALALRTELNGEIALLRSEMTTLERRFMIKMGAMLVAAIGISLALEKLIK